MPSYTCDAISNLFIAESGRFSGDLYRKLAPSSIWAANTPRGQWTDGMGKTLSNILFERTVPTSTTSKTPGAVDSKWVADAFSDGNVDACLPTPEILDSGQTTRSYNIVARNLQSREFCVEDLRSDHDIVSMINALNSNFQWSTNYVWDDFDRSEYIRVADHKVTESANVGFNLDATSFDLVNNPPTSKLTVGTLEQMYDYLLWNGAGVEVMGTNDTGRPILDLFTDATTQRDLIRQDPDLREDFRFAYEGQGVNMPLLKSRGSAFTWNGYRFITDTFPERYNVSGATVTRVLPYKDVESTTKGFKQEVNPAYRFAQYQISVIHIASVFKQLVKQPISTLGKFKFDPVKYTGDFQMLNIKDKKCNPRGTKMFLDAIFAAATEPGNTHLGVAIAHLNCPPIRKIYGSCYS